MNVLNKRGSYATYTFPSGMGVKRGSCATYTFPSGMGGKRGSCATYTFPSGMGGKRGSCATYTFPSGMGGKRGSCATYTFPFLQNGKRGLSPVVATVLLVSITLILAVIVFFWARSFIGETIEKNERAIEMSCEEVDFLIEAYNDGSGKGKLSVQNIGSVSIYGVEMRIKGKGEIKEIGRSCVTVNPGNTETYELIEGVDSGDTIIAVPILLGETNTEKVAHVCDSDYG